MKDFLKNVGINEEPRRVITLSGGANNRVYRLDFEKRKSLVCKHYFQHPDDLRQRLQAEFSFLSYAWKIGLRQIPQPLGFDERKNLALYSFVPGQPIEAVNDEMIDQTCAFFLKLNAHKKEIQGLPLASESCLMIEDFFSTVERKLAQCRAISLDSPLHHDVKRFIETDLVPTWEILLKDVSFSFNQAVAEDDLCITPSDFGFHNALIDVKQLYFLDFEYAGWDDPTKTACDFFCQPKVPVPLKYFEQVTEAVASTTTNPDIYLKRIKAMLPICRIKWCCIILNAFQKTGQERRRFSDPQVFEKLEKQFSLAKNYLQRCLHGIH